MDGVGQIVDVTFDPHLAVAAMRITGTDIERPVTIDLVVQPAARIVREQIIFAVEDRHILRRAIAGGQDVIRLAAAHVEALPNRCVHLKPRGAGQALVGDRAEYGFGRRNVGLEAKILDFARLFHLRFEPQSVDVEVDVVR